MKIKSKDLLRRSLGILLALVLCLPSLALPVRAEKSEGEPEAALALPAEEEAGEGEAEATKAGTPKSSVLAMDYTAPKELSSYPSDVYGVEKNQPFLLSEENELALIVGKGMNASSKTTLTIMDTFDFKKKSTDGDYTIINCPNPANAVSTETTDDTVGSAFEGLEYAQAVGFDGDGSGRKHYIATAGYDTQNSAVWLSIYDAHTQETLKMLIGITLPDYLKSVQEGYWSQDNFLAITAGDYDKDGRESVILYFHEVSFGYFGLYEISISEHEGALTWDDCHMECILDLNTSLDGIFNESRKSDFTGESAKKMPAVSLATGDFNGDGKDQLAAAFSFYNPSDNVKNGYVDTLCGEDGLDPFIMTRVVIFDRTSSGWQHTAPIMMYDIVASEYETSGSDVIYPVNMMHGGRIAAGDVDNNGIDEIVVVGYGSMATKAEHTTAYARVTYRNGKPYSVSHIGDFMRDKLFSSVIYYGGGGYVRTSLQRFQMQQAITTTFARNIDDKYSVFAPIAVACARTNGHNQPAVVFINGVLYDFRKKTPTVLCDDTFIGKNDLGQEAWYNPDTGPRKYVMNWVRNVAVGNFDGNTAGREQFIFTFWQSQIAGQYNSWLSVIAGVDYGDELDPSGSMTFGTPAKYACNFIPLNFECNGYNHDLLTGDAQWGAMIHNGATTDAAGSTRLAAIPVAVDVDDDGTLGRFNKSGYVYTDPEVMAVLEAAPYFSEVAEAGGYSGDGETSYSFSVEYGSGTSRTDSYAFEVGIAAEASAGPVKASLEAGYANDWSHTFEQVYSVSVEESYSATTKDLVVLRRIPVLIYTYDIWDKTTSDWIINGMNVQVPVSPRIIKLTIDDYNAFVDEYNAKIGADSPYALVKIKKGTDLPANHEGNPDKYWSDWSDGGAGSTQLSASHYELGHDNGSTQCTYSQSVQTSESTETSQGLHFGLTLQFGGDYVVGEAWAGAYANVDVSTSKGTVTTTVHGTSGGGRVQDINKETVKGLNKDQVQAGYKFIWTFGKWMRRLSNSEGAPQVPFYGYVLPEVVRVKPSIKTQPADLSVAAGDTAKFTAKGTGLALSYQWYYRKTASDSWTAVSASSGKKATYSLTAAERHNGYQYRCKVKNAAGHKYTKAVTLTVLTKPAIVTQPKSTSVAAGKTAKFTVAATGGDLSYQWYYRKTSTDSWTAVSATSGKTATYSLTAAERHNGYQYRCRVKNAAGTTYTKAVTLTVCTKPVIATQPKSTSVAAGKTAKFTVKATGEALTYQWYYRKNSSDSWTAVSAASGKTATYSMTAQARHNGYQYRCKVTNAAGYTYTKTVTLTVK